MKLKVKNKEIIIFRQTVDGIITSLSMANKRSRYLSALQRMHDALEPTISSIEKKHKALQEKYARVDPDTNTFIFGTRGEYTYTKDNQAQMENDFEEYNESYRTLDLSIPHTILSKDDLPKDGMGNIQIANKLVKVLCPFVIDEKLRDELLYGDIEETSKSNGVKKSETIIELKKT